LRTKGDGPRAYFRRFYVHRAARILPLYLTVLALLFVFARGQYGAFFALCALMAANVATALGVPVPDAAGPYWSLAVEEQYYLIWPWLVLKFDRKALSWIALAVIAIEPLARLSARGHQLELTWFRADGLAMGAFIATWFAGWNGDVRRARTLALALLGAALVVTLAAVPFGILHESIASKSLRITQAVLAFGSLVVLAIAYSGAPALGILRSRFAVLTALLSYCLYLIHKPLSDAFEWVFARTPFAAHLAPEPTLLVRIVCVLPLAYGIAALSRRFLELPFIRLGARS
jgi:peptidoglycan/LPS O-acetylase OafA/YrhL